MIRACRLGIFTLASLLPMQAARAGMISTFADRARFETAAGTPLTVEDFTDSNHFPISTGVLNSATDLVVESGPPIRPGDIKPGVTYSTRIGQSFFFNIDSEGGFEGGYLDGFVQEDYDNVLTITFDDPTSAFGFDTNLFMGSAFDITVHFGSGSAFSDTFAVAPKSQMQFYGFLSDRTDITSVEILGNGEFFSFAVDNFTFQPGAAAVPEPSSLLMAGFGGVLAALAVRKRNR